MSSFSDTKKERNIFESISFTTLLFVTFLIPIFFIPILGIPVQFGTSLLFALGTIFSLIFYIISGLV